MVESLGRYPRCSMEIEMYENMRSIGTVKCNGILIALAAGNIL